MFAEVANKREHALSHVQTKHIEIVYLVVKVRRRSFLCDETILTIWSQLCVCGACSAKLHYVRLQSAANLLIYFTIKIASIIDCLFALRFGVEYSVFA